MTVPDMSTDLEATAKRVKELSDQVAAQAKENGLAWLEGYEKVLKNMLDLEEQAAKGTGLDWATTLATTHANFVRELSEVFFSALSSQNSPVSARALRPPPLVTGASAETRSSVLRHPAP